MLDEFKATNGEIKYAFILGDPLSGEIVDILPSDSKSFYMIISIKSQMKKDST